MVNQDFCLIVEFHLFQVSLSVFTSILNSPCGCESPFLCHENTPRGQRLLWAGCSQTWLKQCGAFKSKAEYFFIYWHPAAWQPSTTTTVIGWACYQNALMIKGKRCPGDWKKMLFHWRQLRITHYYFCSFRICRVLKGWVCDWQRDLFEKLSSNVPFGKGDLLWQPFSAPQRHMLCEIRRVPLKHKLLPADKLSQRSFYISSIHTTETASINCPVWSNASLQTSRSFRTLRILELI